MAPKSRSMNIGDKVEVRGETGWIRFIGETDFANGIWYGIELEKTRGKNDGSVNNKHYFKCDHLHGIFVRQSMLETAEPDGSKLHLIIDKLQAKLKSTVFDLHDYRARLENADLKLNSASDRLEVVSLDRDFLSESNDILSAKLKNLQANYDDLKLEYTILKEEVDLNNQIEQEVKIQLSSSQDSPETTLILTRNEQLSQALINLQDLLNSKELDFNNEICRLKSEVVTKLDYDALASKFTVANETISTLQSQLDLTLESEKLIEQLSLDNEHLLNEVAQLNNTIDELNEIHELDRSLEENQQAVEEKLRQDMKELKELVKSDKTLIDSLERKNKFLESRIEEEKDLPSIQNKSKDESNDNYANQNHILKQFDLLQHSSSIELELAELKLNILDDKLKMFIDDLNTAIKIIFKIKFCTSLANLIYKYLNSQSTKILSYEYNKLGHFLIMIQLFCEYNYTNTKFSSEEFNDMLTDLNTLLLDSIEKIKNKNIYELELKQIQKFIETILYYVDFDHEELVGKTHFYGIFTSELVNLEMKSYSVITHEIRAFLYDANKNKPLLDELTIVTNQINSILESYQEKKSLMKNEDNLHIAVDELFKLKFLINVKQISADLVNKLYKNSSSSELIEITSLLRDEDGINLLKKLSDAVNNYNKIRLSLASNNLNSTTIFSSTQPKIDVPKKDKQDVKELDSGNEIQELKDQLSERQKKLQDYELNISLLQANMRSLDEQRVTEVSNIQKQFTEAKDAHLKDKQVIEKLIKDNNKLQSDLDAMLKSNAMFELRKFDNLNSENQNVERLAIIEEIITLRKMVLLNFDKGNKPDDYSWLEQPLSNTIVSRPSEQEIEFQRSGKIIRELASKIKLIKLQQDRSWQPRAKSGKYINLQFEETVSNFEALQLKSLV